MKDELYYWILNWSFDTVYFSSSSYNTLYIRFALDIFFSLCTVHTCNTVLGRVYATRVKRTHSFPPRRPPASVLKPNAGFQFLSVIYYCHYYRYLTIGRISYMCVTATHIITWSSVVAIPYDIIVIFVFGSYPSFPLYVWHNTIGRYR